VGGGGIWELLGRCLGMGGRGVWKGVGMRLKPRASVSMAILSPLLHIEAYVCFVHLQSFSEQRNGVRYSTEITVLGA